MTTSLITAILDEAQRDWIYEAWIYSQVQRAMRDEADGAEEGDSPEPEVVRAHAIDLTERLLKEGLLVAGDVAPSGFTPWEMSGAEAARTVRERWSADASPIVELGSVAWFDITPAGEAWLSKRPDGSVEVTDTTYIDCFAQFLAGEMGSTDFADEFWRIYSADTRTGDRVRYEILQSVFYAVEDSNPSDDRRADEIGPQELTSAVARAKRALEDRLGAASDT